MIITAIKLLAGPVVSYFTERSKAAAATRAQKTELAGVKHVARLENIRQGKINEATWNEKQIEKGGWARDWLTILLSIPMVLAFVPYMVPHVTAGFAALQQMPEWYKAAIGLMIGASFGYQKYVQHTMNKAYSLPEKK